MKLTSIIKVILLLIFDYFFIYHLAGSNIAILLVLLVFLYTFFGCHIDLRRDKAIKLKLLNDYERDRLDQIRITLIEDVKNQLGFDISRIQFYIIPSNESNAFCYGLRHIAITRKAFEAMDDMLICSILAHEVSHAIHLDPDFNRLMFANISMLIFGLAASSFISVSIIVIIFMCLCLAGIFRSFVSIYIFQLFIKVVKWIFTCLQYIVLFIYRTIIGFISRLCEYRADKFSWYVYEEQICYFLYRFTSDTKYQSLSEILYASHPPSYKRIRRLENYNKQQLVLLKRQN